MFLLQRPTQPSPTFLAIRWHSQGIVSGSRKHRIARAIMVPSPAAAIGSIPGVDGVPPQRHRETEHGPGDALARHQLQVRPRMDPHERDDARRQDRHAQDQQQVIDHHARQDLGAQDPRDVVELVPVDAAGSVAIGNLEEAAADASGGRIAGRGAGEFGQVQMHEQHCHIQLSGIYGAVARIVTDVKSLRNNGPERSAVVQTKCVIARAQTCMEGLR